MVPCCCPWLAASHASRKKCMQLCGCCGHASQTSPPPDCFLCPNTNYQFELVAKAHSLLQTVHGSPAPSTLPAYQHHCMQLNVMEFPLCADESGSVSTPRTCFLMCA